MQPLLELFVKQQKAQQEQQKAQQEQQREQQMILLALVEQQKEELAHQRRHGEAQEATRHTREGVDNNSLTKADPAKKLGPNDDIENFLTTFERFAKQQGW